MAKDSSKKWALGAAFAALAGYLAGLLTAPKSGKETREDIKDTAEKDVAAAEKQLKQAQDEADKAVKAAKAGAAKLKGEAKEELDLLLDKADEAKGKAQEILKAVKAGEADDRDLQEAINSVSDALGHLKKYLKKI